MSSKNRRFDPHKSYIRKVKKLQSAGLLGTVDTRKKPDKATLQALARYDDILKGHAQVIKIPPPPKLARGLRRKHGLRGKNDVVIIAKDKREKWRFVKTTGELKSTRPGYQPGDKIHKTLGEKFKVPPKNTKAYYTIPARRRGLGTLQRHTFSSFDEMLYYLMKYDVDFEDIEDFIEIEYLEEGSKAESDKRERIVRERHKASRKRRSKRSRMKGR